VLGSFGVQLALISFTLTSLVIVTFAAVTVLVTYNANESAMRNSLLNTVTNVMVHRWDPEEITKTLTNDAFVAGATRKDDFFYEASNRRGADVVASENWPESFKAPRRPSEPRPGDVRPDHGRMGPPPPGRGPGGAGRPPHDRPHERPAREHLAREAPEPREDDEYNEVEPYLDSVSEEVRRRPPASAAEQAGAGRGPDDQTGAMVRIMPPSPPVYSNMTMNGRNYRVVTMFSPGRSATVGFAEGMVLSRTIETLTPLAWLLAGSLVVIALLSWLLGMRALRPVKRLSATAEEITAEDLDRRLDPSREAVEFEDLIGVFNGMLERLDRSFQQARRFSADAAHELKTPLTILQGELERDASSAHPGEQTGQMLEEVQRLKTIVEKLSLLAKADAGRLPITPEDVKLKDLVGEMVEDAELLAPHLKVTSSIDPEARVRAVDPDLFRHVLQNLLSNAIKYNVHEGWIHIALESAPNADIIEVRNSCHPLPQDAGKRMFERFYRGDAAHNREVDGTGLGLSLCREIATAHGATLEMIPSDSGQVTLRLTLPFEANATPKAPAPPPQNHRRKESTPADESYGIPRVRPAS